MMACKHGIISTGRCGGLEASRDCLMNRFKPVLVVWVLGAAMLIAATPAVAGPWDFDGQAELTKEKIQTFLQRSIVHFDTAAFNNFNIVDWERTKLFLQNTGAKFIHGGELSW